MYSPPRDPSGFYLLTGPGPVEIWIESDRIEECMAYYRDQGLSRISLSPLMGYALSDIDFLKDHNYVRGVALPNAEQLNVDGLHHLPGLDYLLMAGNKQGFDLAKFP